MPAPHRALFASSLGVLLITGCAPPGTDDGPETLTTAARAKLAPRALDELVAGGATQLLLVIDDGCGSSGTAAS